MVHCLLFIFLLCLLGLAHAQTCYNHSGSVAEASWNYTPCGYGTSYCCPAGAICVTDGICRDVNNHANDSDVIIGGQLVNFTRTRSYRSVHECELDWMS